MKFLCIACESYMGLQKLEEVAERSWGVVFACPRCGHRMAMVTNPGETSLVQALGVKIGGQDTAAAPMQLTREMMKGDSGAAPAPSAEAGSAGGCPFGALLGQDAGLPELPWTKEAERRLENIPAFVRPMAKRAIEQMARDRGQSEVNAELMDLAKGTFMGTEDGG